MMLNLQTLFFTLVNGQTVNQEYNLWFIFEGLLIGGVIIFQFFRSRRIYVKINQLKEIFSYPLKVTSGYIEKEDLNKFDEAVSKIAFINESENNSSPDRIPGKNIVKVSITETSGTNTAILRIKDAINTYLLSNYGAAVNFSIIKDIIDRETDIQDEDISQDIPTPLYFGLAATMVGIIFGLISMPGLNGDKFTSGINSLIDGVKLAMSASLFGLLCTTYLSSFHYKNAKKQILGDKNAQFSYLQAKLLPELIKAEDTGVSGLKASLDRFAKVATVISDNVLNAANQTGENILLQQQVIEKVSNLDIIKISETNLELFKRLEDNMKALLKFSEYLSSMNQISENLKEFAFRTLDINKVVNKIDSGLEENNRLSRFLTAHFEKIETAGNSALKAVDLSDSLFKEAIEKLREETDGCLNQALTAVNLSSAHFSDAIGKLKEETDRRISQLNQDAANNESKLSGIYSDIGAKLGMITSQHINQFQSAYSNAIPHFNQLNNLEILPGMQNELNKITENLINNPVLAKLDSIESQLKTHKLRIRKPRNATNVNIKKPFTGFWRKLWNPFRPFR